MEDSLSEGVLGQNNTNVLGYRPFKPADVERQRREIEKHQKLEAAEGLMKTISSPPVKFKATVAGEECVFKYAALQYNGENRNIKYILTQMEKEANPNLRGIGATFNLDSIGGGRSLYVKITTPLSILDSGNSETLGLNIGKYLSKELTRIYGGITDRQKRLREEKEELSAEVIEQNRTGNVKNETPEAGKETILSIINKKGGTVHILEGLGSLTVIRADLRGGRALEISSEDGLFWNVNIYDVAGIESQKGLRNCAVADIQDFIEKNYEG